MDPNDCGCEVEIWDCQGGPIPVPVDSSGCPIGDKYCKIQVGPQAGPITVAAAGTGTITIAITDFTWAKVKGLVLSAFDAAAGNADVLRTIGVTQIKVQGIENTDGEVSAERYRGDATGSGRGTGQHYRGTMGSAGGTMTIGVVNNSLVAAVIGAAVDVDASR